MANHTFDHWMKNTVSVLEERMIAAGILNPDTDHLSYQVGSPTYGNSHYVAKTDNKTGGISIIFQASPNVKRDEFRNMIGQASFMLHVANKVTGNE